MSRYPQAAFLKSAGAPAAFGDDSGAEVAFAGRSNSGKSSAINAIAGHRALARTSRTPGRTRLVNFFELEPGRRLVDLPGYGFAQVPARVRADWGRLIEAFFASRASLTGLFVVVDARRGLRESDATMLAYAAARDLPVHVLLTKADHLGRSASAGALRAARDGLAGRATVQLFSATTGQGVEPARGALEAMFAGRQQSRDDQRR